MMLIFVPSSHLLQKATIGSTVVTSTSSSSAASPPATWRHSEVSNICQKDVLGDLQSETFVFKLMCACVSMCVCVLPVCSGSLLSSSSMSNSDSRSSYSTFSSSSLKSGAKALQFSYQINIHTLSVVSFGSETAQNSLPKTHYLPLGSVPR